jgi:hypothetical protein
MMHLFDRVAFSLKFFEHVEHRTCSRDDVLNRYIGVFIKIGYTDPRLILTVTLERRSHGTEADRMLQLGSRTKIKMLAHRKM